MSTVETTIPALLEHAATEHGDRPFIVDGDTTLSFKDTLTQVRALAAKLHHQGFTPGDVGAIWAPNCYEWIVTALAIQYLGGTLVTLNTRYKGTEAADILRASRAQWLFLIDEFLGTNYPASLSNEDLGGLQQVVFRAASNDAMAQFDSWLLAGNDLLQDSKILAALEQSRDRVSAESVSDILFTSGTTGRAKGVVTHHGQNIRAFNTFADILGLDATDRYLIINPFFHSFGYKAGWLAALLRGATVYPLAVFDVPAVLDQITRHAITVMPGPPTLFQSILAHPELATSDLSSLIKATTGAAVIPTQLIVDMRNILGIDTVITAYGLSESCGLVTMCRSGDDPEIIAGTSGRAIPGVELGIMAADGSLLPPGESGEIVVRGFNVMQGYLDNPTATAETIDNNGWLHTGDIGHTDADGNLSITDRLKDMYISGGFNCYPAEIEKQLLGHPDIVQAAVIGVPDIRMGEVGAAFIVLTANSESDSATLDAWCREHIANYKVPRHIEIVDALPLNASGKVLKTELRKHYAAHEAQTKE